MGTTTSREGGGGGRSAGAGGEAPLVYVENVCKIYFKYTNFGKSILYTF